VSWTELTALPIIGRALSPHGLVAIHRIHHEEILWASAEAGVSTVSDVLMVGGLGPQALFYFSLTRSRRKPPNHKTAHLETAAHEEP
jgi:hypothetical protein